MEKSWALVDFAEPNGQKIVNASHPTILRCQNHTSSRLPRSDLVPRCHEKMIRCTDCLSKNVNQHGYIVKPTNEWISAGRPPVEMPFMGGDVPCSQFRFLPSSAGLQVNPKWLFQTCPTPFFVNLPTWFSEFYVVETVWNSSRPLLFVTSKILSGTELRGSSFRAQRCASRKERTWADWIIGCLQFDRRSTGQPEKACYQGAQ